MRARKETEVEIDRMPTSWHGWMLVREFVSFGKCPIFDQIAGEWPIFEFESELHAE
jgi:hypothetical protein